MIHNFTEMLREAAFRRTSSLMACALSLSLSLCLSLSLSLSFQAELQDRDPYSINPNLYTLNPKPGTWNS